MSLSGAKIIELAKIKGQKTRKCIFCSNSKKLLYFREKTVCLDCFRSIPYLFQDEYWRVSQDEYWRVSQKE
ncbi:MAG: hypothetical protein AWM53_00531 [Candidatus Dichloromethanomonas elyunquensis]|nr:MAG: hypothetical protein AWM53_00531 [Candidatus Dichloromethanomonas elyunquensis]